MTKTEALEAMSQGKKVRHRWFSPDEWMKKEGGLYLLEDGVRCTPAEFWYDRKDSSWETDWEIVE